MVFASRSNSTSGSSTPPAPQLRARRAARQDRFLHRPRIQTTNIFGTPLANITPRDFKGKQSKTPGACCGSCHPDGLADGVTWIFAPGPRQTNR